MSLIEECYASGRGELVDTIEARKEGGTVSHCYCSGWEDRVCTTEDGRTLTFIAMAMDLALPKNCLLYTSPSPRDLSTSRMPSSA